MARPFVKWAGGKRALVDKLLAHAPATFNDYYEPFVGGGALFFALADRLRRAHLSDNNAALITTYNVVQEWPDKLITRLKVHRAAHSKDYFYRMRDEKPVKLVDVAARFIYLNKTCFNGLYRVNRSGQFNVPLGSYKNPAIVDEENIRACSHALARAVLRHAPFQASKPKRGDFVYFDPPYLPVKADSFTAYSADAFGQAEHTALRDFALALHKRGVRVMLSNSQTDFTDRLYGSAPFRLTAVEAPRHVNRDAKGRGKVGEYIITTY